MEPFPAVCGSVEPAIAFPERMKRRSAAETVLPRSKPRPLDDR